MELRIKRWGRRALTLLIALAIAATAAWYGFLKPKTPGQSWLMAVDDPIPGPRTCFWLRGPAGADPYINIAYPDAATFYWAAVFTIPEGAKLRLEGNFPHSRYMSLISYDEKGQPVESVADYLIKPDEGATNPFLPDADRSAAKRSYRLEIVDGLQPEGQPTGMNLVGQTRDTLHAPKYGTGQQAILYRIYANDRGRDETGGAGMPVPVVTTKEGKELRGLEACEALNFRQPLQIDIAAMAVPMDKYQQLLKAAAAISPFHPATNPPTWHQQYDRDALYAIYTGAPFNIDGRKSTGGFYPNLDNQYIRTIVNRKLGKILVVRGKAPTTPKTLDGQAKAEPADLRYWSFCSNQGFANTRVNGCVHDENVPVNKDGVYTIVLSRKEDRPRNARTECGVAWLPMADDGDGSGDADVTVFQLRHMLGAGEFKHAVQGVSAPGAEEQDMGEYFPKARYMSPSAFETALPCLIRKPIWQFW
ncbi:MAG: hypothetical protein IPL47_17155 [Phyllobacteriaceae bacterium]|nr:hypothetical protein [Phyllobacteriaceae bacterium]